MLLNERSDELCRKLNTELMRFTPGGRFYSVRQLIDRFQVSRRVVDAALARLVEQQVLEIRPNCGAFVKEIRKCHSVAYFHLDWPGETVRELIHSLTSEFSASEPPVRFSALPYAYDADLTDMLDGCVADAIIIGYPAREPTLKELTYLAASDRPIITLERDLRDAGLHSTSGSPEIGAFLAFQYLAERGHRRFAVLSADPEAGEVGRRVRAFLQFAAGSGCQARRIACDSKDGDYATTMAYEALTRDLEKHGCDYSGLFITGDDPCKGALLALHEAGIRVPSDVSMIGYGFSPGPRYFTPPLTTVACRPADCARSLARALKNYFAGDRSLIAIRDIPVVIERSSVTNHQE